MNDASVDSEQLISDTFNHTNVEPTRYHYMDNMRALAMLLGIFFHAALAYSPMMKNLWPAADPMSSSVLDVVAWFTHTFRMPLFFIIAGFFAIMLIEKRGVKGFVKNRLLRIGIPFLLFLPLCLGAIFAAYGWALENVQHPSPSLQFMQTMLNDPNAPNMPFSTAHLWFLFNLLLFCITLSIIAKTSLFKSPKITRLISTNNIVFIAPLFIVPALISQPSPLPAPERIYPEAWSFGYYGILFLIGNMLFLKKNIINELKRYNHLLLSASIAMFIGYYQFIPQSLSMEQMMAPPSVDWSIAVFIKAILAAYLAVWMSLWCLSVGKSLLNRQNRVLRYIAHSSYWVYIVHLPVLFTLQFLLLDLNAHYSIKFLIGSFGTLAIGLISYQLLVAKTPIGSLLNGKKR